jgi:hypothetical protein
MSWCAEGQQLHLATPIHTRCKVLEVCYSTSISLAMIHSPRACCMRLCNTLMAGDCAAAEQHSISTQNTKSQSTANRSSSQFLLQAGSS